MIEEIKKIFDDCIQRMEQEFHEIQQVFHETKLVFQETEKSYDKALDAIRQCNNTMDTILRFIGAE